MTKLEMIQKLVQKTKVSEKEAETALEFTDWDLLDAALLLERERGGDRTAYTTERQAPPPQEEAPEVKDRRWVRILKKIWAMLKKAVEYGNRNHFQIHRKEETVLELPVTVLVILIIAAFWVTIPLLVLGLFLGCRYSFIGPDLGKAIVNGAMDAAAKTAEKVKEEVAKD